MGVYYKHKYILGGTFLEVRGTITYIFILAFGISKQSFEANTDSIPEMMACLFSLKYNPVVFGYQLNLCSSN